MRLDESLLLAVSWPPWLPHTGRAQQGARFIANVSLTCGNGSETSLTDLVVPKPLAGTVSGPVTTGRAGAALTTGRRRLAYMVLTQPMPTSATSAS